MVRYISIYINIYLYIYIYIYIYIFIYLFIYISIYIYIYISIYIGNSKDVEKLQKHFRKMFAGIHTVTLSENRETIIGFASKEGEIVDFCTPVTIKDQKINTWLAGLESEMRLTLAKLLSDSTNMLLATSGTFNIKHYLVWVDKFQAQLVLLSAQVYWSQAVENALVSLSTGGNAGVLQAVVSTVEVTLAALADTVLLYQPPIRRLKLEHLITELVHQRDVTRELVMKGIKSPKDFTWLSQMRYYFSPKNNNVLQQLQIRIANADFCYGFEYLGLVDKLVQTPLTDKAYMTLTQGLKARQGGAPFGPAGTGKTETVKSLGCQLGRFTLVFNCDETFDAGAMERIFVGLCQVGAWGCFDEFNRLEEKQLSAVSQQIQTIQQTLKDMVGKPEGSVSTVEFGGRKPFKLNADMGIFITMNPGYAGRSNLPDNLKQLFRNLAMARPDRQLIAEVMLYSQGFRTAEVLSKKIVPLFVLCEEQLSAQSHYDFGLRALKAVLVSAGSIKRIQLDAARATNLSNNLTSEEEDKPGVISEQNVLIQSISETMIPKLVSDDIPLLRSLLSDVFPGVEYTSNAMVDLREKVI